MAVFDFGPGAVYLIFAWEGTDGLWRMDLASGSLTQVASIPDIWVGDGEKAWAGSVNPADPHPLPGFQTQPDQVDLVTVSSGQRQTWLYRPGSSVYVAGLDGHGRPLVGVVAGKEVAIGYVTGDTVEVVVLDSPGAARSVFSGPLARFDDFLPTAIDRHGVWFGGKAGIYLLEDGGTLRKVSDFAGRPAGGCI